MGRPALYVSARNNRYRTFPKGPGSPGRSARRPFPPGCAASRSWSQRGTWRPGFALRRPRAMVASRGTAGAATGVVAQGRWQRTRRPIHCMGKRTAPGRKPFLDVPRLFTPPPCPRPAATAPCCTHPRSAHPAPRSRAFPPPSRSRTCDTAPAPGHCRCRR